MIKKGAILLSSLLLASLYAAPISASGEGPVVNAKVDKRIVYVGDRIRYTLKTVYRDQAEIRTPDFKDGHIGGFEIKDSGARTKSGLFGARENINWYDIAAYDVGKKEIPSVDIGYRKKGAKVWDTIKAPSVNIEVRSLLTSAGAPSDIKDIKGPLGFFDINWWLVGGILIVLITLVAFIIKKTRRKIPVRLPHETALEELEAVRGDYLKGGGVKEYYVGVSDCVRRYIERVFRLKAPEMTTEEFLGSLGETNALTMEHKSLLKEFLDACDLVKFAKHAPKTAEIDSVYETAKKFTEETKNIYANV